MPEVTAPLNKRLAQRAFARAAASYDKAAVLQRAMAECLFQRLATLPLAPKWILDLGCGTGAASGVLLARYPKARLLALDFAYPMLIRTRQHSNWWRYPHGVCADAERLPLVNASIDLVYSNATLQWCNDIEATFNEWRRVLRPDGLLIFSTFGPETLAELRTAWAAVDGYHHVSDFAELRVLGDGLLRAGFTAPVVDMERFVLTYERVVDLMRDLKTLGAHNVHHKRALGLTGKGHLAAMIQAYEPFRVDGRLPASYQVIYGCAWAPR